MAYANTLLPPARQAPRRAPDLAADLAAFIGSERFPCAGARSALALDQVTVAEAGDLLSADSDRQIYQALHAFGSALDPDQMPFKTFVCGFRRGAVMDEKTFETALWGLLQRLHDRARSVAWASHVSSDPASPEFNISINGVPYFVIGLHPGASRAARRFCRPALVFNSHDQFEQLRADGRYQALQKVIRQRELDVNGSINPMLGTHGQRNQAPQYSGRHVGDDWTCPFKYEPPMAD